MANAYRNTGTHFRFDADDQLFHAKMRVQVLDADGEHFLEFVTQVATLLELVAWILDMLSGLSNQVGGTQPGVPKGVYEVTYTPT